MNIKQLEYFIAVAENLNFTRAAEKFYISQTAITQQIKSLEEYLGVQLFIRNKRHVELTPSGVGFLKESRAIISRTNDAIHKTRLISTGITGSLKIGFVKGYEKTDFSNILQSFHSKYPNIFLSLIRENADVLYDRVIEGDLDIAFIILFEGKHRPKIEYGFVRKYPLNAVVSSDHPLAHRKSIKRKDLKGHPFIELKTQEQDYGQSAKIRREFLEAGFLPNISVQSDDIETSLMMASAGLGYALLPSYITDTITSRERLVVIPIEGEEQHMEIDVIWNQENENPVLREFLKEI